MSLGRLLGVRVNTFGLGGYLWSSTTVSLSWKPLALVTRHKAPIAFLMAFTKVRFGVCVRAALGSGIQGEVHLHCVSTDRLYQYYPRSDDLVVGRRGSFPYFFVIARVGVCGLKLGSVLY